MFPKHGDVGDEWMDSLTEYPVLGARGFLLLCPVMAGV
jgi:hypothetical protein